MRHSTILRGILVVLVLSEIVGWSGAAPGTIAGGLASVLRLPFFAPALLGAFAAQLVLRPTRRELVASLVAAAGMFWPLWQRLSGEPFGLASAVGSALGLGSLVVLTLLACQARGAERRSVLDVLEPALILPGFVILAYPMGYLTAALWPTTWDHRLFLVDAAFGAPLSFVVGRWAAAVPQLLAICLAVYVALPLALMLVQAMRQRQGERSSDALVAFIVLTLVGYVGYMAVPVAGPVYAFGDLFPALPPDPLTLSAAKSLAPPVPRNCMPSLHSGWALLVWWNARPLPRVARVVASVFLAITLLSTVALGFHYVVDLVAAFPLTMAVQAWATRVSDAGLRRRAIAFGAATTLGWMAMVTWLPGLPQWPVPLLWALAVAIVAASSVLERRVYAVRVQAGSGPEIEEVPFAIDLVASDAVAHDWIAHDSTDVVEGAARAGALQAWRSTAVAALLVLLGLSGFVHWAIVRQTLGLVFGATVAARAAMATLALFGFAAGLALGGKFAALLPNPLRVTAWVAALMTTAVWSTQRMVPWVEGVWTAQAHHADSAWFAALLSSTALQAVALVPGALLAGIAVVLLAEERRRRLPGYDTGLTVAAGLLLSGAALGALATGTVVIPTFYSLALPTALLLLVVVGSGVFSLSISPPELELCDSEEKNGPTIVGTLPLPGWRNSGGLAALGVVLGTLTASMLMVQRGFVGDTVYSRAHGSFLLAVGLALGALLARRASVASRVGLGWALAATSMMLWLGASLWMQVPDYFASFAGYGQQHRMLTFPAERELVRLCVGAFLLLPASLGLGASLQFAVDGVDPRQSEQATEAAALAWAVVVAGAAFALWGTAAVVVPLLGPMTALAAVSGVCALAAASLLRSAPLGTPAIAGLSAIAFVGLLAFPSSLEWAGVSSRTGLLFSKEPDSGQRVNWPLASEGLVPVRENSAGSLPGDRVVLGRDARSILLGDPQVLDRIELDGSAVHQPEVASQFSREFYALVAARLSPRGVMLQRFDLRQFSAIGLVSVLASAHLRFDELRVEVNAEEATLVACRASCPQQIRSASAVPTPNRPHEMALGLSNSGVEELLRSSAERLHVAPEVLASTDQDMFLAFHAPAAFVLPADQEPESLILLRGAVTGAGGGTSAALDVKDPVPLSETVPATD